MITNFIRNIVKQEIKQEIAKEKTSRSGLSMNMIAGMACIGALLYLEYKSKKAGNIFNEISNLDFDSMKEILEKEKEKNKTPELDLPGEEEPG